MQNLKEYIDSGILEMYVLGDTSDEQNHEIAEVASAYPEIREEINILSAAIEGYAKANAIEPDPTLKPFLLAKIDYYERLKNGEEPCEPPLLNQSSKISDYNEWLTRDDAQLPENFQHFHAKILGLTPRVTTAIIWIQHMAPEEMHHNQLENFLILQGTCDIRVEDEVFSLKAGDYFSIPLHKNHDVKITSSIPCKAILQRIAA